MNFLTYSKQRRISALYLIVLCALLSILTQSALSQTEIAGEVFGVWNIEGSPYIAIEAISVPVGEQLTIEPGVEVRFDGELPFIINGLLRALGTEDDSIWFISNDPDQDVRWAGIQFIEAEDRNEIAFSHISGVGWDDAPQEATGVHVNHSSVIIRNSLITECNEGPLVEGGSEGDYNCAGIWVLSAINSVIENNTIQGNTGTAIWCHHDGAVRISGNLICENSGHGIDAFGSYRDVNPLLIQNNRILNNNMYGLLLRNGLSIVENNTISGNERGGIYSIATKLVVKGSVFTNNSSDRYGGGLMISRGRAIVAGNIFAGNFAERSGGGVYFHMPPQIHFYNNIVYGNRANSGPGGIGHRPSGYQWNVQNCILWNNQGDDIARNFENIEFSTVQSRFGEEGMVNVVPRFIDAENGDFRLIEDSPLIDSGNPFQLYNDADGSRADIGVYGGNDLLFGFGQSVEFREVGHYCHMEDNVTFCNLNENVVNLDRILFSDNDNFSVECEQPVSMLPAKWYDLPLSFHPLGAGNYEAFSFFIFEDYNPLERAVIRLYGTALDGFSGPISGVWTQEMSPIHIIGTVEILEKDTLRIEPGVEVLFDPETRFSASGVILAIGTSEDSIRFTSVRDDPAPGDWDELIIRGRLAYCVVEYLARGLHLRIGEIKHSSIRFASGFGVILSNSTRLENNSITNCASAISCTDSSWANHNLFAFNDEVVVAQSIRDIWGDFLTEYLKCEGNIFYQNGSVRTFDLPHPYFRYNCIFESEVEGGVLVGDLDFENFNGTACDENFNIIMDPQFVDPENLDFHLSENSPCIDAGNQLLYRDPDGSWADMGPLPFNHDEEPPIIFVDPEFIEVEEPSEHVINITNLGNGRLWWRIFVDSEWAVCDPSNGVLGQEVDLDMIVTLEDLDLEPGIYETDLIIDSNDPENPLYVIPISMRIGGENIRALDVFLREGWNIISLNINPLNCYVEDEDRGPDVIRMFEPIIDDLIIVKDELGRFYTPDFDFNNIPFWSLTEGYLVKTNRDIEITWSGEIISADTDIPLSEGWNYAAYFPEFELDASAPDFHVLSPIIESVNIAKDESGRFLNPEFGFSNMPPWRESKGYQIRVNEDVVLNYPQAQDDVAFTHPCFPIENRGSEQDHWQFPTSTGENMSLLITSVSGIEIEKGDQIAAFNLDGNLVGVGNIEADGRCGLALWGDDKTTEVKDGLVQGEEFELRLWTSKTNVENSLSIESSQFEYQPIFEPDGFCALELRSAIQLPDEFSLSNPYPNPFNSSISIDYSIPNPGQTKLSIYDLSGREIAVLVDEQLKAGNHKINWQAQDQPSGLYFARLQFGSEIRNKRLVLIK